jgi:hypothetical protein
MIRHVITVVSARWSWAELIETSIFMLALAQLGILYLLVC